MPPAALGRQCCPPGAFGFLFLWREGVLRIERLLVAYFLGLLALSVCYFPNMGGVGLNLPVNALCYAALAGVMLFIWCRLPLRRGIVVTPASGYLLFAVALLFIPLAYGYAPGFSTAAWRLAGLLAGWGFYFSWLQVRMPFRLRAHLMVLLLVLVLGQAVIALLQLFAPALSWVPLRGTRVFGVFQQPNVLGSFIATGLALALMLFLLPSYALKSAKQERWRRSGLGVLLVLLPALLVWIQSRAGWLGGALAALGFLLCFGRRYRWQAGAAMALVLGGVGIGIVVLLGQESAGVLRYLTHEQSNLARVLMLQDTLRMIAERPFAGWGYGSFDYAFQHFRVHQASPTQVQEIARHPHNEILLWWVEGGLIALCGLGIAIAAGVRVLRQAIKHDRAAFAAGRANAGEATALCLVMVPMLMHTQLEYPFYLSALHWALFMLLLATLDRLTGRKRRVVHLSPMAGVALKAGLASVLAVGAGVMLAAFYVGQTLTCVERGGLRDVEPLAALPPVVAWPLQERLAFDLQTHALLVYNRTRDEALLWRYADWAEAYLAQRTDANVYASLIAILYHQQRNVAAERYRREAALLFPKDRRF